MMAPNTGVIGALAIDEGGHVDRGQTLAIVKTSRNMVSGNTASAALEALINKRRSALVGTEKAQQRQYETLANGVEEQLAAARRELQQLTAEVAIRREQLTIASETLDRLRHLQGKGYVSDLRILQQEIATLDAKGPVQSLLRQASNARRGVAQMELALQELPTKRQAKGALSIQSPVDGVVATLLVKQGQAVKQGDLLMFLLPGDGRLKAELLVPGRAIGSVNPGDRVLLRYQAYPYQKFGHHQGNIVRISRSPINADLGSSAQAQGPLYRVRVELVEQTMTDHGETKRLKPGMKLKADIFGERRRLVEWLFQPLYSLKGTLADN